MAICGIYKITNKITGEAYIGQSVDIHRRWQQHRKAPYSGKKCAKYPLYRDAIHYGWELFDFSIIEQCPKDYLDMRETYWINFYGTINQYNQIMPGEQPLDAKKRRRKRN